MPRLHPIVGHERQLKELETDLAQGNLSHAYLFGGPAHLGKMSIAFWLAERLLCTGLSADAQRIAHRSIENLTHPDLLVLDQLWIEQTNDDWNCIARFSNVPQSHREKNKTKTDSIGIDDVRALQQRLHETSIGTYRCCIIRSVERMQDTAANAFLKILEEPPERLIFLLTTQEQASLLPTITSRTRTIRFAPLPHSALKPLLENMSDDDVRFILKLAQGAPGVIQRLRDNPDALRQERQVYGQAMTFWETPSLQARLQTLAPLLQRNEETDRLLLHLALALRQQPKSFQKRAYSPFQQLLQDLRTNAHRELIAQRFALHIGS